MSALVLEAAPFAAPQAGKRARAAQADVSDASQARERRRSSGRICGCL
jgi:hypothetical protein